MKHGKHLYLMVSLVLVAGVLLLTGNGGGGLVLLLALSACAVMMFLMMRGMGGMDGGRRSRDGHGDSEDKNATSNGHHQHR